MALGVGPASAANPTWKITARLLPTEVAPGNNAGYFVTVENIGPSNINALTLKVTPESTPTGTTLNEPSHFDGLTWNFGGPGSCTESGQLVCDLGTFAAGARVTFTVAYGVPTGTSGTFDVMFSLRAGTGDTGSDGKGKSRGDQGDFPFSTDVNTTANFDGGFAVDETLFQTIGTLGRQNKQNSSVDSPESLVPVTIEELAPGDVTCNPACPGAFGEWTALNVADNKDYDDETPTPFQVTIFVWGGAVPGGTSVDQIYVLHTTNAGATYEIREHCTPSTGTPTNAECLTVTKVGSNYKIVVWLYQNGNLRGGF